MGEEGEEKEKGQGGGRDGGEGGCEGHGLGRGYSVSHVDFSPSWDGNNSD